MKLATSLMIAALALAPALASAKEGTVAKAMTSAKNAVTGTVSTPVNINTASETDLKAVFKSDKTAKKVIDNRTYAKTDDLVSKKIITKASYKSVEKKITVQ